MLRKSILLLLVLLSLTSYGQQYEMALPLFTSNGSVNNLNVVTDEVGNIYASGTYNNTVDFDPGVRSYTMTSVGGRDIYLAKYNKSGKFIWAISIGGQLNEDTYTGTLKVDSGHVYIAGTFSQMVDFDPGPTYAIWTANGSTDGFVAKYDTLGNFFWSNPITGPNTGGEQSRNMTVDALGNILVIGSAVGNIDFNPMPGMTATVNITGAYAVKYSSQGNFIWAINIPGVNFLSRIVADPLNNLYITGNLSSGSNGIIAKINHFGLLVWTAPIKNTSQFEFTSLTLDSTSCDLYVSGTFRGTTDFDPDVTNTYNLTSVAGSFDNSFIGKYDSSGHFKWVKSFFCNSNSVDIPDIARDKSGNIYAGINFVGTLDADPGAGTANYSSISEDYLIAMYDPSGNYLSAKQFSTSSIENINSVYIDRSDKIFVGGYFTQIIDMDPGIAIQNIGTASNTAQKGFIAQYNYYCHPFQTTSGAINTTLCQSDTAELYVTTTGDQISYQWMKNNALLSNSSKYAGVNTLKLIINNLQPADNGQYRCILSNSCTTTDTSGIHTISVNSLPNAPSPISGQTNTTKGLTSYNVTNDPAVSYAWDVTGGKITGQGNNISVNWLVTGNQTITCTALNACGASPVVSLGVTVTTGSVPDVSGNVCFEAVREAYDADNLSANALVSGDFNSDNKIDIAFTAGNTGNVCVMLGNGDGSLKDKVYYDVDLSTNTNVPMGIATADYNNDNILDLAVTNYQSNKLTIMSGNGTGGFSYSSSYSTGNRATSILSGDFNHDNHPDIVLGYQGTITNSSVFLNNGTGVFTHDKDYSLGVGDISFTLMNFNNDIYPDLISAKDSLRVLYGSSTGNFSKGPSYGYVGGSNYVHKLLTYDVNKDGLQDVVIASSNSAFGGGIYIYLKDNTNQNLIVPTSHILSFSAVNLIDTADVNKDGLKDIIVNGNSYCTITSSVTATNLVYFAVSNTIFSDAEPLDLNGDAFIDMICTDNITGLRDIEKFTGESPGGFIQAKEVVGSYDNMKLADFNGDKMDDIVYIKTISSGVYKLALSYGGNNGFTSEVVNSESFSTIGQLFLGKVNTDSYMDVVVVTANKLYIKYGNGNGSFTPSNNITINVATPITSAVIEDFTNDGKKDILLYDSFNSKLFLYSYNSALSLIATYTVVNTNAPVLSGHFNNDTIPDITFTDYNNNYLWIMYGLPSGEGLSLPQKYQTGNRPTQIAKGNFNNDHVEDLALINALDYSFTVYLSKSNGTFVKGNSYKSVSATNGYQIMVADVDKDMIDDIVYFMNGLGTIQASINVYTGKGDGSFSLLSNNTANGTGSGTGSIVMGDYNGDSYTDIAFTGSQVTFMLGKKNGTFDGPILYSLPGISGAGFNADVNGDKKTDLVISKSTNGYFLMYNKSAIIHSANDTTVICNGTSLQLSAGFGDHYSWSNGMTTKNILISDSTSYTTTIVNNDGCTTTSSPFKIKIKPFHVPSLLFSKDTTAICSGDLLTMDAGSGYSKYKWNTAVADTLRSLTTNKNGSYSCIVYASNGCYDTTDNVKINFKALPQPILNSGDKSVCENDTLFVKTTADFVSYSWSDGYTVKQRPVYAAGNYYVRVTNSAGCKNNSDTIAITINAKPAKPSINVVGNLVFCANDSVQLAGPSGYQKYLWNGQQDIQTLTIKISDTMSLTVMDSHNCLSIPSDEIITKMNSVPSKPILHVSGNTQFCAGDSVLLFTDISSDKYYWSTGDSTSSIYVKNQGTYFVGLVNTNRCTNKSSSQSVIVNHISKPVITNINDSLISNVQGDSYEWYINNILVQNSNHQNIKLSEVGDYKLQVVALGCVSDTSAPFHYVINGVSSKQKNADLKIDVYPNPNNGKFILSMQGVTSPIESIQVVDVTGKIVYSYELSGVVSENFYEEISGSLTSGVYTIKIVMDNNAFFNTMIVMK